MSEQEYKDLQKFRTLTAQLSSAEKAMLRDVLNMIEQRGEVDKHE